MKKLNKVIAVLCSATMILGSTMTAFAADPDTAAGDGNILVFSVETVTLPTSINVAFNPNGYTVTKKAGVTTTDQIVSLNYGIASTANKDRKVTVSFKATGVAGTGTEEVVFVDAIEKAQAKTTDNADGADYGEYKMYLAAVASAAAPKDGESAFTVSEGASTATAAKLADVSFTAAEEGEVAFASGKDANIAYKLDHATYEQKTGDDGKIDFETTQAQMAGKFSLKSLGENGVVGFTFKGAMNPNADWTKAKITALKIQPEYEIEDIDGTEVALGENGGLGQIEVAASAAEPVTGTGMTKASGKAWNYEATFTKGTDYEISFNGVTAGTQSNTVDGTYATSANVVVGTNKVTIKSTNWGGASVGDARFVKVSDGTNTYIIKFTVASGS